MNTVLLWRVWRYGSSVVEASFVSERLARLFIGANGESAVLTCGVDFCGMFRKGEGWVL